MDPKLLQLIRNIISQELALKNPTQPQSQPIQQVTIQDTKKIIEIENKLKEIENKIPEIDVSPKSQPLNYTTRGEQDGQEVRFTLFGQVLTPEEEALYGDINYIEFGGSGSPHPFRIKSTKNIDFDPPTYDISINAGTINGVIATNWNNIFTRDNEDPVYVVLSVITDGRSIISCSLEFDDSPPLTVSRAQRWNLASSFKVLIGAVAGTTVKQVVFNNLSANGKKVLTTEKVLVNMNELPYDNWYAWEVR